MFKKLSEILTSTNLSFILSEKNGIISATVIPKSKEGKDISNTPLSLSGTAEEMDENFADEVGKALGQAMGFLTNADQFVKDAKKKEEDAKKAKEKPQASSSTTTTKPAEKKTLTADQKKVKKSAETNLEKAKKEKDPEVINFLKNQTVKAYKEAKFDDADIAELEKSFDTIIADGPKSETEKPEVKNETDLFSNPGELAPPDQIEDDKDEDDGETSNETQDNDDADNDTDDDDIF